MASQGDFSHPFTFWNFEQSVFLKFHFRLPSHKNHYHNCIWYSYHSDICLDYPKIMTEKWNLAVNFNCLDLELFFRSNLGLIINFYAPRPSALAVRKWSIWHMDHLLCRCGSRLLESKKKKAVYTATRVSFLLVNMYLTATRMWLYPHVDAVDTACGHKVKTQAWGCIHCKKKNANATTITTQRVVALAFFLLLESKKKS